MHVEAVRMLVREHHRELLHEAECERLAASAARAARAARDGRGRAASGGGRLGSLRCAAGSAVVALGLRLGGRRTGLEPD